MHAFAFSHFTLLTFQLSKDSTFKLFPVSVNVRPAAPVFLTFLVSKPGPVWRLTIQQNLQCVHHDSGDVEDVLLGDAGEGEEELEHESGVSVPEATTEIPGEMERKLECGICDLFPKPLPATAN